MNFYEDLEQRAKNDHRWENRKNFYDSQIIDIDRKISQSTNNDEIFKLLDYKLALKKVLIELLTDERLKLQRTLVETLKRGTK